MLAALEINLAVMLFVSAADMTRGQPAVVIAAPGFFLWFEQAPMRTGFRNLIEGRRLLETLNGRERTITFERHKLYQLDLLALSERHDCFFPMRASSE